MKILVSILSVLAAILIVFNLTKINYSNPFNDDSIIAIITIFTGLCAILLLRILMVSKKIERLLKKKS